MDYTKNVIGLFAVLMLLTTVSAEVLVPETGTPWDLNFEDYPIIGVGTPFDDGVSQLHDMRVFNNVINQNAVYIKFIDLDSSPDPTTTIDFNCTHSNKTITLGSFSHWVADDWVIIDTTLFAGDRSQTVASSSGEAGDITYSQSCNITVNGDDVFAITYFVIDSSSGIGATTMGEALALEFQTPDTSMNLIMDSAKNVTASAFDLMEILLTVSAVILLVFLIMFAWNFIEVISNRVSRAKDI